MLTFLLPPSRGIKCNQKASIGDFFCSPEGCTEYKEKDCPDVNFCQSVILTIPKTTDAIGLFEKPVQKDFS